MCDYHESYSTYEVPCGECSKCRKLSIRCLNRRVCGPVCRNLCRKSYVVYESSDTDTDSDLDNPVVYSYSKRKNIPYWLENIGYDGSAPEPYAPGYRKAYFNKRTKCVDMYQNKPIIGTTPLRYTPFVRYKGGVEVDPDFVFFDGAQKSTLIITLPVVVRKGRIVGIGVFVTPNEENGEVVDFVLPSAFIEGLSPCNTASSKSAAAQVFADWVGQPISASNAQHFFSGLGDKDKPQGETRVCVYVVPFSHNGDATPNEEVAQANNLQRKPRSIYPAPQFLHFINSTQLQKALTDNKLHVVTHRQREGKYYEKQVSDEWYKGAVSRLIAKLASHAFM